MSNNQEHEKKIELGCRKKLKVLCLSTLDEYCSKKVKIKWQKLRVLTTSETSANIISTKYSSTYYFSIELKFSLQEVQEKTLLSACHFV